ncbi:MAG: hypothetical protein ABIK89_07240 [Planctomycetota bacterium]
MSWPLASHFSAMLQNPRVAFRDPKLKQCRIEKDRSNQPRPWSGAFAAVYKGILPDGEGPVAVRVFTTESPQRRERYEAISAYLKTRRLDCLVDFEYRDNSIRSAGDGKWYPVILMDWVEGETLFHWVGSRCREGNQEALAAAAAGWVELVKELADARIAHGDLQDANVMVTRGGQLKLVDYDCMCVPALVGRRNLEVGVEPYQHPDRNERTHLSHDLDHFSALVIYVALRALAAEPSLWRKYVEQPAHDKLLFRTDDFRAPGTDAKRWSPSPLVRELTNSPAEDVRELTAKLLSLVEVPMDRLPTLAQLTNSYVKIEELLQSQQWDAAVELLNRRGQFRDAPEHLEPLIHVAYEYVCRKQAWAAFEKLLARGRQVGESEDRKLVSAWNETLFAGFEPAERERARVAAARKNAGILDRLHRMAQGPPQETTLEEERKIAALAKHLPKGYEHTLRPRVERARRCVHAMRRLDRVLRESEGVAAIVAAWRRVVEAECQRFVDPEDRPRIELAQKQLALVEGLQRIPEDLPPEQLDRRLIDLWNEELAQGCHEAEAWRPAYEGAVYRRQLLDRIQRAIDGRDDVTLIELVEEPSLEGYSLSGGWATAIRTARDRVAKTETLVSALENGDRAAFVEAFDARLIRKHGGRFRAHEPVLSDWTRSEILPLEGLGLSLAVGRASLFCLDKAEGTYRVRWTWPQQRFTDECFLAILADEPEPDSDPRDLEIQHRLPIDRQSWEDGGGSRVVHVEPEWAGSPVIVWATVDLGFRTFASRPLVLGRLDGGRKGKRSEGRGARAWRFVRSLVPRPSPLSPHDEGDPQ